MLQKTDGNVDVAMTVEDIVYGANRKNVRQQQHVLYNYLKSITGNQKAECDALYGMLQCFVHLKALNQQEADKALADFGYEEDTFFLTASQALNHLTKQHFPEFDTHVFYGAKLWILHLAERAGATVTLGTDQRGHPTLTVTCKGGAEGAFHFQPREGEHPEDFFTHLVFTPKAWNRVHEEPFGERMLRLAVSPIGQKFMAELDATAGPGPHSDQECVRKLVADYENRLKKSSKNGVERVILWAVLTAEDNNSDIVNAQGLKLSNRHPAVKLHKKKKWRLVAPNKNGIGGEHVTLQYNIDSSCLRGLSLTDMELKVVLGSFYWNEKMGVGAYVVDFVDGDVYRTLKSANLLPSVPHITICVAPEAHPEASGPMIMDKSSSEERDGFFGEELVLRVQITSMALLKEAVA